MSNYVHYVAYYTPNNNLNENILIGKYKLNMAYNTLLELAELVGKKIYSL